MTIDQFAELYSQQMSEFREAWWFSFVWFDETFA